MPPKHVLLNRVRELEKTVEAQARRIDVLERAVDRLERPPYSPLAPQDPVYPVYPSFPVTCDSNLPKETFK